MSPASLALLRAAQTGDLQLLESALENGADIHAIQGKDSIHRGSALPADLGAAALNAAIRAAEKKELTGNHIEMIERLLACGVDVHQKLYPDPGSYPIHAAVYGGHDPLMHLLTERGATLFTTGREGASLLRWAASSGTTWLISLLLERIATSSPNEPDEVMSRGLEHALYEAAQNGHRAIVELLLDFGVNVDAHNSSGFNRGDTALMSAASSGQAEIVDLLRSRGADTGATGDRGMTVLLGAARGGLTDLVLELLADGADPNACDLHDQTPLPYAAAQGNEVLSRALVAQGADLRARVPCSILPDAVRPRVPRSILRSAATGGLGWLMEACLEAGEAVDVEDDWGYTPLMSAALSGHVEAMQFLVERGVRINHVAHYQGETALHYTIYGKQLAAAQWLVERGADLNAEMEEAALGRWLTPLMNAAVSNQADLMKMLIQAGADVKARNSEDGCTALHYAAESSAVEAVEVLLHYGADANARTSEGTTPLMASVTGGNTQIMASLIERGAEVNARGDLDNTVLHEAAHDGRDNLVRLLLDYGATWQTLNENGETPLSLAEVAGQYHVVQILHSPRTRQKPMPTKR